MGMHFDPNASSLGPVQGPGFVTPASGREDTETHDPTQSSIQQSLAEALGVQFLAGWPVLQHPEGGGNYASPAAIAGIFSTKTAEIINNMWDSYLDHLEEQKERIVDYLKSAAYRQFVEEKTMGGQVHERITTNIDTESPVYSTSEFNTYLNSRSRFQNAIDLWTNTFDGVSNYVRDNREENPAAALFVVASFAITSTYIGDYMQIVDVASTDMVTVNPIQDSVGHILPLVPQSVQEQFTLAINLFAIGLINFSNGEAILKVGEQTQRPPTNWESIVTFAHNVLENIEGNVVNAYLMAMLVNHIDQLGATEEQRGKTLAKLEILAKAFMLSVAIAALLKAATPDLRLNGLIFTKTMEEPLLAMSDEDKKLVNELAPLVRQFNELREEGTMSEEFWSNLMASLGDFFDSDPAVEDLINPTRIYRELVKNLFNSELEG